MFVPWHAFINTGIEKDGPELRDGSFDPFLRAQRAVGDGERTVHPYVPLDFGSGGLRNPHTHPAPHLLPTTLEDLVAPAGSYLRTLLR